MADTYSDTAEGLRRALAEKNAENAELREELRRRDARLAELTEAGREERLRFAHTVRQLEEESETLRRERDGLQQLLEEARADLQETAEEMAAAARFSENEWREHCDRVEAQCVRLQKTVNACVPAALAYLTHEEPVVRQELQEEEEEQRCDLQGPRWEASLEEVPAREAARIKAVFAARGLPMSELHRTHLGNIPFTGNNLSAAGEGLYKLFVALRPGGSVDRFAMRELLKGETNATAVWYSTQGHENVWAGNHFAIPAADACELAACVLCHLPALRSLSFSHLPPLSTQSFEWVSHLPQCMERLFFWYTDYTVADLRELHRRRGSRSFRVLVEASKCTDWGELAGAGDDDTKTARLNEELGGMVEWL